MGGDILTLIDIIVPMVIIRGMMIGVIMDTDMVMETIIPTPGATTTIHLMGTAIEEDTILPEIFRKEILQKGQAHSEAHQEQECQGLQVE